MNNKLLLFPLLVFLAIAASAKITTSSTIVISQIYGDGGTTGSTYSNDFIELYNRGTSSVNLSNYSVQYSTGTAWVVTPLTAVILQPGTYYLIKEASNGAGGAALPAADVTGSISLHSNNGKVALVNSTSALPNGCTSPLIIDLVGYGNATCYEGAAATGGTNILSIIRKQGNDDTDNNSADFITATPVPRNLSFTLPFSLYNFSVNKNGNKNELHWRLNCISASVTFEVQRSVNAQNFETIHTETANRARCASAFTYTDAGFLYSNNYYRLKITDIDNNVFYSPVEFIGNAPAKGALTITPSIVTSGATLNYVSFTPENVQWVINDMQGRQVKKFSTQVTPGKNLIIFQASSFPAGQYQVKGYTIKGIISTTNFIKH